jgi:tRNA/tmRNA/rRNA uracil-C5-methylase (TrmA/RlmC/RlmD family)
MKPLKKLKKRIEKSKSRVRYSGVCQCEIYEHCSKCDPESFKEKQKL